MAKLLKSCKIPFSKEDIWLYMGHHESIFRLTPPWQDISHYKNDASNHTFRLHENIFFKWVVHLNRSTNLSSDDIQLTDTFLRSPFPLLQHKRTFKKATQNGETCKIEDEITYTAPWGNIGYTLNKKEIAGNLNKIIKFQHTRIQQDIADMKEVTRPQSILITGSNGFIGRHLRAYLRVIGHYITPLVHQKDGKNPCWNPDKNEVYPENFEDHDTVIHLAGESLFNKRWSSTQKEYIIENRSKSAALLAETIANLENKPKTLIVASAIGYYGNAGDADLTEESPAGEDFAADVCTAIEHALKPAKDAGVRVVILRLGVVLSPRGGALKQMLLPFKLGLGGAMGDGKQFLSWIGLEDVLRIFNFMLKNENLSGVFNATAPQPLRNKKFSQILAKNLKRPCLFPMPAFIIKLIWGEMGETLLLSSAKVLPKRLLDAGFHFITPSLDKALDLELKGHYPRKDEQ